MSTWRRTYWSVWTANLIVSIGMMSFLPFFPSLLGELGLTGKTEIAAWSGLVFGAAPLSATVMSPIWGALGDRIGRKIMVLRSMVAIALFVGMMGFAETPTQLLLLRIGQGIFSGFIPPSITLVSIGAPADRQGRVAGNLTTALALGAILGPALGGILAASTGYRSVFFVVGALAAVGAVLVGLFAHEDKGHRQVAQDGASAPGILRGVMSDVRELLARKRVRAMVLLVFFLQFGLGSSNPILELYVHDLLPAGSESLGFWRSLGGLVPGGGVADDAGARALATSGLFSGMALANLLSLSAWGHYGDRVGHRRALGLCGIGSAVALLVQAALPAYSALFFARVLFGVAMAGVGPLAFGLIAGEVAVDRRGGAFGLVFSARTLAVAVGGMTGGLLSSFIGIRGVMLISAVFIAAALVAQRRPEKLTD
jgi:DHA1 family multidrug resistance protein-like MFS transporter